MRDDDISGAQLGGIVVGAFDADRAGRMEAMPHRLAASLDPLDRQRDDLAAEQRDDALQRADPAQAFGGGAGRAPAHRLGPGEGADDCRHGFGQHVGGGTAGLVHHGEPDAVAILKLILGQAGLAQEAFKRLRRGAGAGTLELLADRRGFQRQVASDQRQAARRDEAVDRRGLEPGLGQFLGEEARQIVGRLQLHARGNFLAAQFKEEIGHAISSDAPAQAGAASECSATWPEIPAFAGMTKLFMVIRRSIRWSSSTLRSYPSPCRGPGPYSWRAPARRSRRAPAAD